MVGLLFNVLPLRIDLDGVSTVRDLVRRVQAVALDAYLHGEVPMEDIAVSLGYGQAVLGGGPPLWEAAVNVRSDPGIVGASDQDSSEFDRWLFSIRAVPILQRWDGRILEVVATDHPALTDGVLIYNSEVFEQAHAALVAAEVAAFLFQLPTLIDAPLTAIWK